MVRGRQGGRDEVAALQVGGRDGGCGEACVPLGGCIWLPFCYGGAHRAGSFLLSFLDVLFLMILCRLSFLVHNRLFGLLRGEVMGVVFGRVQLR